MPTNFGIKKTNYGVKRTPTQMTENCANSLTTSLTFFRLSFWGCKCNSGDAKESKNSPHRLIVLTQMYKCTIKYIDL